MDFWFLFYCLFQFNLSTPGNSLKPSTKLYLLNCRLLSTSTVVYNLCCWHAPLFYNRIDELVQLSIFICLLLFLWPRSINLDSRIFRPWLASRGMSDCALESGFLFFIWLLREIYGFTRYQPSSKQLERAEFFTFENDMTL